MSRPFDPDWVVRPGATLREWRDEHRLTIAQAALRCGMLATTFEGIERGLASITPNLARGLAMGTGVSAEFWLARERDYRDGLARGKVEP